MKERYNSNSKFKIYFETLPEKFGTGMLLAPAKFSKLDVEGKVFSQALKKQHLFFNGSGYHQEILLTYIEFYLIPSISV